MSTQSNKEPGLGRLDIREPNQQIIKNIFKVIGIPMIRLDMFSRYCVQDAEGIMSGFVTVIPTKKENQLWLWYQQRKKTVIAEQIWQCDLYTQIYTSETVNIEGWWKAGVNAEWILEQLAFLSERGDLTVPRRHRERQQKRFAKDAPRWHHVKSIRAIWTF